MLVRVSAATDMGGRSHMSSVPGLIIVTRVDGKGMRLAVSRVRVASAAPERPPHRSQFVVLFGERLRR